MKYLKTFEYFQDEPRVGDYVKAFGDYFDESIIDFLRNNIGILIEIDPELEFGYLVEFEDEIPIINNNKQRFNIDEIIEWASDKEGLKIKKEINKYNI